MGSPTEVPVARLAEEFPNRSDAPWVPLFLDTLRSWIERNRFNPPSREFRFIPGNQLLGVVGRGPEGELLCHQMSYLDALLWHPHVAPPLKSYLDGACREAGRLAVMKSETCAAMARYGLDGLLGLRDEFFSPQVLKGLEAMNAVRPLPLGISGSVVLRTDAGRQMVVLRRNALVAVNPGIWTLPIDGGVQRLDQPGGWTGDLRHEAKDELPLDEAAAESLDWEPVPFFPGHLGDISLAEQWIRESGVNVLFTADFNMSETFSQDEIVRLISGQLKGKRFYEANAVSLVRLDTVDELVADLVALGQPVSGVLVHTILEALKPEHAEDFRNRLLDGALSGLSRQHHVFSTTSRSPNMAAMNSHQNATLESRFAANVLRRFPHLAELLAQPPAGLESVDEQEVGDTEAVTHWVVEVLLEYRNCLAAMRQSGVDEIDPSRLFEAVVYQLSAIGFGDQPDRIKGVLKSLRYDEDQEEGGFRRQVQEQIEELRDILEDDDAGTEPRIASRGVSESAEELEFTRLWRDTWLLLFCSLLWAHERDRSARAGELALGDEFEMYDITSDPLGLFFRSRAIIASPVTSVAQTNIGLQFALSAQNSFPSNAGIRHTCALFYLRRAVMAPEGPATTAMLEQGLESVDAALLLDSVFAEFYVTKAKLQYKLGLREEAFRNLQSAIELQRYDTGLAVESYEEWVGLLDSWQLG